jgi:hypothetical protein
MNTPVTPPASRSEKTLTKVIAERTKLRHTGAKLVVEALEAQGVTHVFGIPGACGMTVLTTRGRVRVRAHAREKSLENFLPMELNRSVQKNGTAI